MNINVDVDDNDNDNDDSPKYENNESYVKDCFVIIQLENYLLPIFSLLEMKKYLIRLSILLNIIDLNIKLLLQNGNRIKQNIFFQSDDSQYLFLK